VDNEPDLAVAALRQAITLAFPPAVFLGVVTPADNEDWAEEIDDDLDLRDNLGSRAWNELAAQFIDRQAGGLPLLTPEAFAAFLPAWLMRSLDGLSGDNKVREFTVYEFCRTDGHPALREHQRIRHATLNLEQRRAVADFLVLVSRHERSRFLRVSADEALLSFQGEPILPSDSDKRLWVSRN
jgi:hypothetical protein